MMTKQKMTTTKQRQLDFYNLLLSLNDAQKEALEASRFWFLMNRLQFTLSHRGYVRAVRSKLIKKLADEQASANGYCS